MKKIIVILKNGDRISFTVDREWFQYLKNASPEKRDQMLKSELDYLNSLESIESEYYVKSVILVEEEMEL